MNRKVAVVVLNYENWRDTVRCLESLQALNYSNYQIIVVDNGSGNRSVDKIKQWADGKLKVDSEFVKYNPHLKPVFYVEYDRKVAESGGMEEYEKELNKYPTNTRLLIIQTGENLGFSGGNNVAIRYALKKNAEAVLIVNPDVIMQSTGSLNEMVETMFSNDDIFIVGPNVVDISGNRQSPLREPNFLEECINPFVFTIKKRLGNRAIGYLDPIKSDKPYEVRKVAGCCFLMRMSFLKKIGLFDERVFLYCEEPILAAQVKNNKGKLFFVPDIIVKHCHRKPSNIYLKEFFKSRQYYLKNYKKYSTIQLWIINITHKLIGAIVKRKR